MDTTRAQQVIQAEQTLAQAHLDLNLAVIDALLHPDYLILQPGGGVETKAQVLESYRMGGRHWNQAEVDQLAVALYGDVARVSGRWTAAGTNNGSAFDYQARFISIWIWVDERWQNLSYASTEIEEHKNERT